MGISFERDGDRLVVELPEADREALEGQSQLVWQLADKPLETSELWQNWLAKRVKAGGGALSARPCDQPLAVNDLVAPLFKAYQVDGGQVHLAGCQLTDHPFLRLTFPADDTSVCHLFVAPDGSSVSDELVVKLGLDCLGPVGNLAPRIDPTALRALTNAGLRIAAKQSSPRDPEATVVEPLGVAIVWIRHADGQLQFTIGDSSTTLSFSSWAKLLVPQPFVARYSGASTFHLAATDDGRIDAAEQIAACQHSGRRVLQQELVECSVTGQRVLEEFTEVCAVSGRRALRSEFAACSMCQQRVSKASLDDPDGVAPHCKACNHLAKVGKEDPRLVWIISENPGLDRWKRWRLAETETVYIAQASSLTKRLLAVVDKETLAVRYLASGGLLGSGWTEVTGDSREELLRR